MERRTRRVLASEAFGALYNVYIIWVMCRYLESLVAKIGQVGTRYLGVEALSSQLEKYGMGKVFQGGRVR
jgi:hypothetical protein